MREALLYLLPCVYAFLACIGFSMLFNIHGAGMLICAGGGALGWLSYLLTGPLVGNDIIQSFFAALVISAWSEVMARLRKCPVTSYLLVALFPLVPGGGIYYTMEHALNGDTELFLDTLMHTLGLAGALAVGVIVLSLSTGMTSDVNNYLFGSMLAMSGEDVTLSVVLAAAVLMLFVLFYRRIFAVTFDETFARATGGHAEACNMLLALLTAVTIVLGMRVMGTMLISSLIIFPALTAMRVCRSFKSVTLCAAAVSVVCFFVGLCASYLLSTAAGATVVVANILAFLIFAAVGRLRG